METKAPAKSEAEVNSPTKVRNMSAPSPSVNQPSVGSKFSMKVETPSAQLDVIPNLVQETVDLPAAGNQNYTIELKEQATLQFRLPRDKLCPTTVVVFIDPTVFFNAMKNTIEDSLIRLLRLKSTMGGEQLESRVTSTAAALATGCSLIAYMNMRAITLTDDTNRWSNDGLGRPRAAKDLPIPTAFAFAIQQLGTVHIADLPRELVLVPRFPEAGHKFGVPDPYFWNPNSYAQAFEYARSLGMRFSVVDLKAKNGTAWWLFEQYYEDDLFELRCIYPETNYTPSMVAAHTLFLNGTELNPSNVFADLTDLEETGDFGIMLRNPHRGIHESSFGALSDTAADVWINA